MGTPFVAPLGFASVDSAGTISAISGTEDNSVQFYKLATDIIFLAEKAGRRYGPYGKLY